MRVLNRVSIALVMLMFVTTLAFSQDAPAAKFRGLSLDMTVEAIKKQLGPEYKFNTPIGAEQALRLFSPNCMVGFELKSSNPEVEDFFKRARNSDDRQHLTDFPSALLREKPTELTLPLCLFGAEGVQSKDFAQQIVNAYPFVKGTLFNASQVGVSCSSDDECWIGLLPSGELVRISTRYGEIFVSKATDSEKNAILPPQIKF